MDEKLDLESIHIENHSSTIMAAFENFRQQDTMLDVTLACNGLSMKAHKLVLTACSPFFKDLLAENPCSHPVIILKDFEFSYLKAIVDFMYKGVLSVPRQRLMSALKVAEDLQVIGLRHSDLSSIDKYQKLYGQICFKLPLSKKQKKNDSSNSKKEYVNVSESYKNAEEIEKCSSANKFPLNSGKVCHDVPEKDESVVEIDSSMSADGLPVLDDKSIDKVKENNLNIKDSRPIVLRTKESTDTRMNPASSNTDLLKGTITAHKGTEDTHVVSVIENAASSSKLICVENSNSLAECSPTTSQISFQEGLTIQLRKPGERQLCTPLQVNSSTPQLLHSRAERTGTDKENEHGQQQAATIFCGPDDNNSLYWAITLAYLLPVRNDDTLFEQRYQALFGTEENIHFFEFRTFIRNYNPLLPNEEELAYLVTTTFRNRVVDFMEINLDRFKTFYKMGDDEKYRDNTRNHDTCDGDPEIQAISLLLNCKINVDGQIYPIFYNHEETIVEPEITLMLFHINCSNGNSNRYFYNLEMGLINTYRKSVTDKILEWLPKYCYTKSKECTREHYDDHKRKSLINILDNSNKYKEYLKALKNIPEKSELLKDAFRSLKTEVDALYNNDNYDLVLEISNVKKVDSVINILLSKDNSDLDVLQFQRIVAQTKKVTTKMQLRF